MEKTEKITLRDLGPEYTLYGNKGDVVMGKLHIYDGGCLCGKPALASNSAIYVEKEKQVAGCEKCIAIWKSKQ